MEGLNNRFAEILDTVLVVEKPIRKELGEDSFFCAGSEASALVSVCDGCGGLGARKYESLQGHSGAYIASRTVSGAICDWYQKNCKRSWKDPKELVASVDACIRKAYAVCEPYGVEKMRIMGSMVRKFPTTLALAYAEADKEGIVVHLLWAGDSRVYLLDRNGLAQLTKDDTDVEDAYENLLSDGAMTNVLSSDGKYGLNYRTLYLTEPCLIFAATDGCFGYIPSPMEFEYTVLKTLTESKTPVEFKVLLQETFAHYAEDDFTFGMMSFFYGSFKQTGKQLQVRLTELEKEYIQILDADGDDEVTKKLWDIYKPGYERYLHEEMKEKDTSEKM